jgi:hypothetical protein
MEDVRHSALSTKDLHKMLKTLKKKDLNGRTIPVKRFFKTCGFHMTLKTLALCYEHVLISFFISEIKRIFILSQIPATLQETLTYLESYVQKGDPGCVADAVDCVQFFKPGSAKEYSLRSLIQSITDEDYDAALVSLAFLHDGDDFKTSLEEIKRNFGKFIGQKSLDKLLESE